MVGVFVFICVYVALNTCNLGFKGSSHILMNPILNIFHWPGSPGKYQGPIRIKPEIPWFPDKSAMGMLTRQILSYAHSV